MARKTPPKEYYNIKDIFNGTTSSMSLAEDYLFNQGRAFRKSIKEFAKQTEKELTYPRVYLTSGKRTIKNPPKSEQAEINTGEYTIRYLKVDDSNYPFFLYRYFQPHNYIFLNANPEIDLNPDYQVIQPSQVPANLVYQRSPYRIDEINEVLRERLMDYGMSLPSSVKMSVRIEQEYQNMRRWIIWGAFCDQLMSVVSAISKQLLYTKNVGLVETRGMSVDKHAMGYITMVTGGMALRAYAPSHYSTDLDVKFFPQNMMADVNQEQFFRDLLFIMNGYLSHLNQYSFQTLTSYIETLKHSALSGNMTFNRFLGEYFAVSNQYQQLMYQMQQRPDLQEQIQEQMRDIFSVQLSDSGRRPEIVYKLIVKFNGQPIQLMDFTLYDKHNETMKKLLRQARERSNPEFAETIRSLGEKYGPMYQIYDPEQTMMPFIRVPNVYLTPVFSGFEPKHNMVPLMPESIEELDTGRVQIDGGEYQKSVGYFHIPTKEFIRAEKEILVSDLEEERYEFNMPHAHEYLVNKMRRTLDTLENEGRPHVYVGGRGKKLRHKGVKKQTRKGGVKGKKVRKHRKTRRK